MTPKRISFGQQDINLDVEPGPIALEDFPSLRDLETSHLFSNNFQATKAARLALQYFDDAKRNKMELLMKSLDYDKSLKFTELYKATKDTKVKNSRLAAT